MLIKKISGNWHKVDVWGKFIIGFKSGGMIIIRDIESEKGEFYFPVYDFSDFMIEEGILYTKDAKGHVFQVHLRSLNKEPGLIKPGECNYFPNPTKKEYTSVKKINNEPKKLFNGARAVDKDKRVIAVAYIRQGIDFIHPGSLEKISHYDLPGYSFIDDIKLQGNKLYIADVFGLRILDITDLKKPVLDDRWSVNRGWPKDVAIYNRYILAADVLGIKIYDKDRDFVLVGRLESNRHRVARVVVRDHYAFLSCEAVGLKIADLSDIENPHLISGIVITSGVWDCALFSDHAYLAAYTTGLLKIDCSDIKNLKHVARYQEPEVKEIIGVSVNEEGVFAACSFGGFTILDHDLNILASLRNVGGRCWSLLAERGFLFAALGSEGVGIYSIEDLKCPMLVDRIAATEARDLAISNNRLYIADGSNGVLVYDIEDCKSVHFLERIPSAAFTRGVAVDESYIYKSDGDGGLEIYEK